MGNRNCCWSSRKEKALKQKTTGAECDTPCAGGGDGKGTGSAFEGRGKHDAEHLSETVQLSVALTYLLTRQCTGLQQKIDDVHKIGALRSRTHECCYFDPDLLAQHAELVEFQSPGQAYSTGALAARFWEEVNFLAENEIIHDASDFQVIVVLTAGNAQNAFYVQMRAGDANAPAQELFLLHQVERTAGGALQPAASKHQSRHAWRGHNCRETVVASRESFDALLALRGELFRSAHSAAHANVQLVCFQHLDSSKSVSDDGAREGDGEGNAVAGIASSSSSEYENGRNGNGLAVRTRRQSDAVGNGTQKARRERLLSGDSFRTGDELSTHALEDMCARFRVKVRADAKHGNVRDVCGAASGIGAGGSGSNGKEDAVRATVSTKTGSHTVIGNFIMC